MPLCHNAQGAKVSEATLNDVFRTELSIVKESLGNDKVIDYTSKMLSAETLARAVVLASAMTQSKTIKSVIVFLFHNAQGTKVSEAIVNGIFTTVLCPCKLIFKE